MGIVVRSAVAESSEPQSMAAGYFCPHSNVKYDLSSNTLKIFSWLSVHFSLSTDGTLHDLHLSKRLRRTPHETRGTYYVACGTCWLASVWWGVARVGRMEG